MYLVKMRRRVACDANTGSQADAKDESDLQKRGEGEFSNVLQTAWRISGFSAKPLLEVLSVRPDRHVVRRP